MQHARRLQRLLRHTWDGSFRRRGLESRGIHHSCLPACLSFSPSVFPLLPSASLAPEDAAFSTRTSLQSSSVSKQYGQYGPPGPLSPIAWSWHGIVTMAACVTLLYGKAPRYFEPLLPVAACLCSRREISNCQVARTVAHTQQCSSSSAHTQHTHHCSTNVPHHFPLKIPSAILRQAAALASMQSIHPASLHPANRNRLCHATQGLT
jgi:hypothetical protein